MPAFDPGGFGGGFDGGGASGSGFDPGGFGGGFDGGADPAPSSSVVTFDPATLTIICQPGVTSVSVAYIYSRWKDWVLTGDNSKYPDAFRTVGGDPTTGGNSIAVYFFLLNGWKLRPQEANHTLIVSGILLVDGGGDPYASTIGTYNVRIVATVPLQAEAIVVETGVSGLTPSESARIAKLDSITVTGGAVDANVAKVNGYSVAGTGQPGSTWGPA